MEGSSSEIERPLVIESLAIDICFTLIVRLYFSSYMISITCDYPLVTVLLEHY